MKKYTILLLLIIAAAHASLAQDKHPFYQDVQTIKSYDKIYQTPAHPILFVGSSSIRKWEHLQMAFGQYNVLNRGIGGAVINDITYYIQDLIFCYQPRQIVLYVGENDVVSPTENADTILNRTIVLYRAIRAQMPDVPIVYIGMKPSPSRDKFMPKTAEANRLIRQFFSTEKNVVFVDVYPLMLRDGHSRPELFGPDMLHMNLDGYTIWENAVRPYLMEAK